LVIYYRFIFSTISSQRIVYQPNCLISFNDFYPSKSYHLIYLVQIYNYILNIQVNIKYIFYL
jgi:hypothetical protein